MSGQTIRKFAAYFGMTVVMLVVAITAAELYLRITRQPVPEGGWALRPCGSDCPHIFSLNPAYESPSISHINRYGFVGPEVTVPKPADVFRILILGDSVTITTDGPQSSTFPWLLQHTLNAEDGKVDLLNASVYMYTAFNEVEFYLHEGRELAPDIVIVSVCLNDIVEPNLHWMGVARRLDGFGMVEGDAIPNQSYRDATRLRAWLERKSDLFYRLMFRNFGRVDVEQKPPVYLTGEQKGVTIRALLDRSSPEWQWLDEMYTKIIDAARADNTEVVFVIHPLGYQLEPDYPYLPQTAFADFCREKGVDCLDLLPTLRAAYDNGDPTFRFSDFESYDVWHYKEGGHAIVADAIVAHLQNQSASWARHRHADADGGRRP